MRYSEFVRLAENPQTESNFLYEIFWTLKGEHYKQYFPQQKYRDEIYKRIALNPNTSIQTIEELVNHGFFPFVLKNKSFELFLLEGSPCLHYYKLHGEIFEQLQKKYTYREISFFEIWPVCGELNGFQTKVLKNCILKEKRASLSMLISRFSVNRLFDRKQEGEIYENYTGRIDNLNKLKEKYL